MPVVERLAQEYGGEIAFIAPAWRSTLELTSGRAQQLIPSGKIRWALDEEEEIFGLYGVPYQPASVFIKDGAIVERWLGARSEEEMRAVLEALIG